MKTFQSLLIGVQIFVGGACAGSTDIKLAALPLSFEPNRGQAASDVLFVTHSRAATVLLNRTHVILDINGYFAP